MAQPIMKLTLMELCLLNGISNNMDIKSAIFYSIEEFFSRFLIVIFIIVSSSLCFLFGINIGKDIAASRLQSEATSLGFARYDVNTNGVVSFKWNK